MRLNDRVIALGGGLALVAGLFAIPTIAQDARFKTKAAPPVRSAETAKVARPPGVHVPEHFNQLEPSLTDEQRERVYEIQARALRECEAVLTAAQRASLQEHRTKGAAPAREERPPAREPARIPARKKAG